MQDDFGNQLPVAAIAKRLVEGDERMEKIENSVAATREDQHDMREQMAEMLEFFQAMKGAFKVLNLIGALARPVAGIVGLGVALTGAWTAVRGGGGR
ncbi:MAG: hypothetical protein PHX60_13325 [Giesbergeria sp.]|uniref:hypothetical protein n=1 Tax=Giesbergeria sp. TaxID=2818473 RepID=UPI0026100600|nr:hypothetical protein [Giesbergeria sp.]MDD2610641.1 hypothetical protein [Giesbergeria sp.]